MERRFDNIGRQAIRAPGISLAIILIPSALLMSASSAAFNGSSPETALQIASLLILLLVVLFVAVLSPGSKLIEAPVYQESRMTAVIVFFFLCSATISCIFAEDIPVSVSNMAGIVLTFVICSAVWNLSLDRIALSLKVYAATAGLCALGVWLLVPSVGHRFGGVLHPNYWGLLCLSVFCLASLMKSVVLRSTIQLISVVIVLLAQARSALLSILVACVVLMVFRFRSAKMRNETKLVALVALVLACFVTVAVAHEQIYDTFATVFRVNDPHRGMTSGFSGRTALWRAGLDVFEAHPWFGVGARMESNFINVGGVTHAHNGYINMLVQFGAIGSGLFLMFSSLAIRRLLYLTRRGEPIGTAGIALVSGYAVGAMFDPKLINIGNPVSIIVMMFLLRPLGRRPVIRCTALNTQR